MVTFLLSSLESCGGGQDLCLQLLERSVCPSSPKKEKVMTMSIFFHSSVRSCGGDHGISSREEGVWPSCTKKEKSMAMVTFLPCSSKGGHGICYHPLEKRGSALLVLGRRG